MIQLAVDRRVALHTTELSTKSKRAVNRSSLFPQFSYHHYHVVQGFALLSKPSKVPAPPRGRGTKTGTSRAVSRDRACRIKRPSGPVHMSLRRRVVSSPRVDERPFEANCAANPFAFVLRLRAIRLGPPLTPEGAFSLVPFSSPAIESNFIFCPSSKRVKERGVREHVRAESQCRPPMPRHYPGFPVTIHRTSSHGLSKSSSQ